MSFCSLGTAPSITESPMALTEPLYAEALDGPFFVSAAALPLLSLFWEDRTSFGGLSAVDDFCSGCLAVWTSFILARYSAFSGCSAWATATPSSASEARMGRTAPVHCRRRRQRGAPWRRGASSRRDPGHHGVWASPPNGRRALRARSLCSGAGRAGEARRRVRPVADG